MSATWLPATSWAETYQNDGLVEGGEAAFQQGFEAGESAVACFTEPDGRYPVRLTAFRFAFGGADTGGQRLVNLHVYSAGALGQPPGMQRFELLDVPVQSAVDGLNAIDISDGAVDADGPWCLGVQLTEGGLPSIARDSDGNIDADANWIRTADGGWLNAARIGLRGDWVIRSVGTPAGAIEPDAGAPPELPADMGVTPPDAQPAADAGPSPDSAMVLADATTPQVDAALRTDSSPIPEADSGSTGGGAAADDGGCSAAPGSDKTPSPWHLGLLVLGGALLSRRTRY